MSSLDARSNLERSGDRDIEHSNLMRYPGTYGELLGDLTKRRPGFEGLRSFDEDVSPLCDFCSHRIAIFEVCRDLLTNKSTRYIETEAKALSAGTKQTISAFAIRKINVHGMFKAKIENMRTGQKWDFDTPSEYIKWVEELYLEHIKEIHGK